MLYDLVSCPHRVTLDLFGDPDLLRREGGGYVAGDIKVGAGEEGPEDHSRPKKHYAVQLALYTDILKRKGLSAGRHAFVWDVNRAELTYDVRHRSKGWWYAARVFADG